MPVKTDSRRMSYAITKLYKHAFATYRHNIFEVDKIESGRPIFLPWDVYERMKLRLRLLDPDTFSGLNLPKFTKPMDGRFDSEYIQEFSQRINIKTIDTVQCKLSNELSIFLCERCLRFIKGTSQLDGNGLKNFRFICPECGYRVSQAPILIYNKKELPGRHHHFPMVKPIRANRKQCQNCGVEDWLGLEVTDPENPMGSLYWKCRKCKSDVEQFKSFQFGYKPQEPTENLTKGITVSTADTENLNKIENTSLNDKYLKGIFYSDKINVFQVTWGYKLGQYENVRYKTFPNNEFYGRKFSTQGFIVEVNESFYESTKKYLEDLYHEDPELYMAFLEDLKGGEPEMEQYQIKRWVLHTLKHSFLGFLPIITGLPTSEFSGAYDLEKNRVIIYDNQEGGIGGCKTLWETPSNMNDLIYLMISRIEECECRNKCPKCLVMNECGEVNQALNRHLLVPLFKDVETFYE